MLLESLVSNALLAIVLAVVVAVFTGFCRRPPVVYWLWMLVLLKFITPPIVGIPLTFNVDVGQTGITDHDLPSSTFPVEASDPAKRLDGDSSASDWTTWRLRDWTSIAVFAWVSGSVVWILLAVIRIVHFGWLVAHAKAAPDALQQKARQLAEQFGLRRCPKVCVAEGRIPPLVWAMTCKPTVLLPSELLDRLTTEQLADLLAHELAHLRRRDHWVRWLEILVLAIYWWHPVAWWSRRKLQEAEEQCCDAWVMWAFPGTARGYVDALLQTVDFLSKGRSVASIAASGVGPVRLLERRIEMILSGENSRNSSWTSKFAVILLGVFVLPWSAQAEGQQYTTVGSVQEGRSDTSKFESAKYSAQVPVVSAGYQSSTSDKGAGDASHTTSDPEVQIRIFSLMKADAAATADVILALFESDSLRVTSDDRTNSLLAKGSPKELDMIKAVVLKLDATESLQRDNTRSSVKPKARPVRTDSIEGKLEKVLQTIPGLETDEKKSAKANPFIHSKPGSIRIEVLEGSDVIVLRGNRVDVERVRRLLSELESGEKNAGETATSEKRTVPE